MPPTSYPYAVFIKPPSVSGQNAPQSTTQSTTQNRNSSVINSIANKPHTPLSENLTASGVNPEITRRPPDSATDGTGSSPDLLAADNTDHARAFTPSIPTHTTVNDNSVTAATTQSEATTRATNATSALIPTTALPPLGELVSNSVKLTILASLKDRLAEYQQQLNRHAANTQPYQGNVTGLAQQPGKIVGVRPDDPVLPIRQQQPQPTVDLSQLIASIEKRVEMYELFNLVSS
ncbi:hypothetical protein [Endozoicomonas sp. SCSIO W0465]|uniref:hypothetical protein n=1 Tax=Endozoicomonas sp. SCSIO W0465 TaxID=2918516 RepID=UPI00207618C6|nr:hypothetical protein [Endozoicomonas sp. SCSIO W0465]USE37118.1 hypothetical protein MJO57_02485 [Endozoicomonas sp. SCSIO W0465]